MLRTVPPGWSFDQLDAWNNLADTADALMALDQIRSLAGKSSDATITTARTQLLQLGSAQLATFSALAAAAQAAGH